MLLPVCCGKGVAAIVVKRRTLFLPLLPEQSVQLQLDLQAMTQSLSVLCVIHVGC